MTPRYRPAAIALLCAWLLTGCSREDSTRIDYGMGEHVPIGPLTYTVIESTWQTQLGDALKLRVPKQRFLLIKVAVTNGGGSELSIPLLEIQNTNGQSYREVEDGEGVSNWLGLIRNMKPAETIEGQIVFDVPLTSYRLRVPDGGAPERRNTPGSLFRLESTWIRSRPFPGAGRRRDKIKPAVCRV